MSSLKQKTFHSIGWSFLDNIFGAGITFVFGIFLARILGPEAFGVVGMVSLLFAFSKIFIESGFSECLIRKVRCSEEEYNTVFFFNLVMSIFIYGLFYVTSSWIAIFFKEPQLTNIIRILSIIIIISAVTIVQRVILTREINFKLQTKISLVSALFSGFVAIVLALNGYGVWSLVYQIMTKEFMNSFLLWLFSKWRPKFTFSVVVFREMLPFSSKMLGGSLLVAISNNIYYIVIGRYFSAAGLGFYTRAEQFSAIVTTNITGVLDRVFYPVFSTIQDDEIQLKVNFKKVMRTSFAITFMALMVLAAMAKPLILVLIGTKWEQSILYLQLLAVTAVFYPIDLLNFNILKVKGRSDLLLKLQIIKMVLLIPIIVVGIIYGIVWMLIARFFTIVICSYFISLYSGSLINYSITEQLKDISPYFKAEFLIIIVIFPISLLHINNIVMILIQLVVGIVLFLFIFEKKQFTEYLEIKELVKALLKK